MLNGRTLIFFKNLIFILILLGFKHSGYAATIIIDVGSYAGAYVTAGLPPQIGNATLSLSAGTYTWQNTDGVSFSYSVDAVGNVTSQQPISAIGIGNTLQFNNVTMTVDPGQFIDGYTQGKVGLQVGISTIVNIPGISETLTNGSGFTIVNYTQGPDGSITINQGASAVFVAGATLTFQNVSMTVDPGQFIDGYTQGKAGSRVGISTVVNIPSVAETLFNGSNFTITTYKQSADGSISLSQGGTSVSVQGSTITFNNINMIVDPVQYQGGYTQGKAGSRAGLNTVVNIPNVGETLFNRVNSIIVSYVEDTNGAITVLAGGASVNVVNGKITFQNTIINVNPGSYSAAYSFFNEPLQIGAAPIIAIPFVNELFSTPPLLNPISTNGFAVTVGGVTSNPNFLNVVINGITYTFSFNVPPTAPQLPTANPGGPYAGSINNPISFDGRGSVDPNGTALTYSWNFGDGSTGVGPTPSHAYSSSGSFTVSLTVTDADNLGNTASTTALIDSPTQQAIALINRIGQLQINGQISQAAASQLQGSLFKFVNAFGGGGSGGGGFGGGGGCGGGGFSGPNFGAAINGLNNFIRQVGNLISSAQLNLQLGLELLEDALLIVRAITGDPTAIIQLASQVINTLATAGIISPADAANIEGDISLVSQGLSLINANSIAQGINAFEGAVSLLGSQGILPQDIANTLDGIAAQMNTLLTNFNPGFLAYDLIKQRLQDLVNTQLAKYGFAQDYIVRLRNDVTDIINGKVAFGISELQQLKFQILNNNKFLVADQQYLANLIQQIVDVANLIP